MSDLHDQIDSAINGWCRHPADTGSVTPDGQCAECREQTDAVMTVVQPFLDGLTAEFGRQIANTAADAMEHRLCHLKLHGALQRAEQAEAELEQVRANRADLVRTIAEDARDTAADLDRPDAEQVTAPAALHKFADDILRGLR